MDYRELVIDTLRKLSQNYVAEKVIKSRIVELEKKLKTNSGERQSEHKRLNLIASIGDEKERLREVVRAIKRTELAFSSIPEEEARVLRAAYVEERKVQEIMKTEYVSERTAYRLRERAIISFAKAFYGVPKC